MRHERILKPAILCLNCQQFSRDVVELINHGTKYRYFPLADTVLAEAQQWVPIPMREQSSYVNFTGPEVDAVWEKSRRYGLSMIEKIRRVAGSDIAAVLAGNWDYWDEECIRLACAELGLPFLVLLRESYLNTYGLEENRDHYAKISRIPQPQAIAMAGEMTVRLFEQLNMFPNVPLVATGWPRLDVWRRPTKPMMDRPVVLMSYRRGYYADRHFLEMLKTFDDMASQYPGIPFVVKAKHGHEAKKLTKIAKELGLTVPVIDVQELPALLCNARVVIGFNSMVMFEALLSAAQLIIPYWGETEQDPGAIAPSPLDERFTDHVAFATSEKILREMVAWSIAGKLPSADVERRSRLYGEFFTYTEDRTSVERVEDFLDAALGR